MPSDSIIDVTPDVKDGSRGMLAFHGQMYFCVLGRAGVVPPAEKQEGDGATPAGIWRLRRVFYRADKISKPETVLDVVDITKDMGWCDAPEHPEYNRLVPLPFDASHEKMWREDDVYDIVVELGYNDDPPLPGLGSAIFMHLMRPDAAPTAGCVALPLPALREILQGCSTNTAIRISEK